MMFVVFFVVLQGMFCAECPDDQVFDSADSVSGARALLPYSQEGCFRGYMRPPPYSPRGTLSPPVETVPLMVERGDPYTVTVRFMSQEGCSYHAIWDTFGLMHKDVAVSFVLERSLLAGDQEGFFMSSEAEVEMMLKAVFKRSVAAGKCTYNLVEGTPLYKERVAQMFPRNEKKQWRVLPEGDPGDGDLIKGEFRLLFAGGGVSCTPFGKKAKVAEAKRAGSTVHANALKSARLHAETEDSFVKKVCEAAELNMGRLQKAIDAENGKVLFKYVTNEGETQGVEWSGRGVIDCNGRTLMNLLRYCVMEGTSVGYVNAADVKYHAFYNDSLRDVLQNLRFDLHTHRTKDFGEKIPMLEARCLQGLPRFSWTVVPPGPMRCIGVKKSCSFTFAGGVTLQGMPVASQGFKPTTGILFPGNYLWALDNKALLFGKPKGASWYDPGPHRTSQKVSWSNG